MLRLADLHEAAPWLALLCAASVSMTLSNKWLMTGILIDYKQVVMLLQNAVAVAVLGTLSASGAMTVTRVNTRQLAFYVWDAFVLVVQLYTSFVALQYLPVAATTVMRALALPLVALSEWLVLGVRLSLAKQAAAAMVVAGAVLYAHEDMLANTSAASSQAAAGYLWAGLNLVAFVSNSLLDRVMMSSSEQSAGGMAMYTLALSIPICWAEGALLEGLTLASTRQLLRGLDAGSACALLVTGAGAALLSSCFAQCYKKASATTVTIASNVNKALAVLLSTLVFRTRPTPTQLAGLAVCLGGAFAFSLAGTRPPKEGTPAEGEAPPASQSAARATTAAAVRARRSQSPGAGTRRSPRARRA